MSLTDDEAQIDAKLRETDRSIAELQKQRQELLQAKRALTTGKTRTEAPQSPKPETTEKAVEKALNTLEWKAFKKKDGEWAFLRDMNGRLVEDLQGVTEFVDQLRKGRQIVVGKYRYSASDDKFLNRFIADDD
jgi:hypothetical protein